MKKIVLSIIVIFSFVSCYKTEDNSVLSSTDNNEYTIKFTVFVDHPDSTKIYDKKEIIEKKVKYGTSLTSDIQPEGLKRTGFKLKGWKDINSTNVITFDGKTVIKKDMQLTGLWEYSELSPTDISELVGLGKLKAADAADGGLLFGKRTISGTNISGNGNCAYCHARTTLETTTTDVAGFDNYVKGKKDSFISMLKQGHNNNLRLQDILHIEAYLKSL